jgi:hypothetical protein
VRIVGLIACNCCKSPSFPRGFVPGRLADRPSAAPLIAFFESDRAWWMAPHQLPGKRKKGGLVVVTSFRGTQRFDFGEF